MNLAEAFKAADTDGDGRISTKEIGDLLESVGKPELQEPILSLMSDQEKSDVGYREFSDLMFDAVRSPGASQEIRQYFRTLDKDNSGSISVEELRKAFAEGGVLFQGYELSAENIEEMIKGSDIDGDGHLNREEFSQSFILEIMRCCVDGKL